VKNWKGPGYSWVGIRFKNQLIMTLRVVHGKGSSFRLVFAVKVLVDLPLPKFNRIVPSRVRARLEID